MKIAAAIVTERGGRTCHAAIVARELGIPAVVGATNAKRTVKAGATVTVSCAEGEAGHVYAGALPVKTTPAQPERTYAAAHRDHGQSWQSGTGLQNRDAAQ